MFLQIGAAGVERWMLKHSLILSSANTWIKHFYCVKLNAERKDTVVIDGVKFTNPNPSSKRSVHQLAVELLKGNMSYPSLVFLNEKSQWLTVVASYLNAKDFEILLHYFGDDAYQKETQWEEYKATFVGELK